MTALIGAVVYLLATLLFWKSPFDGLVLMDETEARISSLPWDFRNPEVDQLLTELKRDREDVSKKQQELNDLEVRLRTERLEINQLLQNLERMQADFDRLVVRVQTEETANLRKLAKIYASMAPEAAANILRELDDVSFVKVLLYMKEGESAPIMESLSRRGAAEARRAASLSEQMRLSLARPPAP
jgi:flagellar motility protein MotE (MotC chaperone)